MLGCIRTWWYNETDVLLHGMTKFVEDGNTVCFMIQNSGKTGNSKPEATATRDFFVLV